MYVVCSGFFDCLSIEDMVLGGRLVSQLGFPHERLDDDALAMVACHTTYSNQAAILQQSWVAKVLHRLGKEGDLVDILGTGRIPTEHMDKMNRLLLQVTFNHGTPAIMPLLL